MAVMQLTDTPARSARLEPSAPTAATALPAASDWRERLPVLSCAGLTLREVEPGDAASLYALLTDPEVARFISPPPSTVDGFERYACWAQRERAAGRYVCFAVVPDGAADAVGIFQMRALDPGFETAEWGFVLGAPFWGRGLFLAGATLMLDFAVGVVGTHRLEARAAVVNARGNAALRKLGAVQEGVLRRSFTRHGQYFDQALWSIIADEWRWQRNGSTPHVH